MEVAPPFHESCTNGKCRALRTLDRQIKKKNQEILGQKESDAAGQFKGRQEFREKEFSILLSAEKKQYLRQSETTPRAEFVKDEDKGT